MANPNDPADFTPADSPLTMTDVIASPAYQDLMTAKIAVGDQAIDFDLPRLDQPHERVRLSAFAGVQPVALIFGSYT